jgi:hypothetical protein
LQRVVRVAVIVVIIVLVVAAAGYAFYYYSNQPNIQATQINISSDKFPQTSLAVNYGQVTSGQFSFTANVNGVYGLVLDNGISFFASKQVSVDYTASGKSASQSFQLSPGQKGFVNVTLTNGQQFSGSYTISGGSGNDLQVYIQANTCTELVSYNFVLVNSGPVSGYATVGLQVDQQTTPSNKYFVTPNQQLRESGSATLPDCNPHSMQVVVLSQQKG